MKSLAGKRIALCITGSVGAVRVPDLVDRLRDMGAEVVPALSEAAKKLVLPALLNDDGDLKANEPRIDLVLVFPVTANTISKIARGICDNQVTLLAAAALGQGVPLVLFPVMHYSMFLHPMVKRNISKLEALGVWCTESVCCEGKAKAPDPGIVSEVVADLL